MFLLSHIWRSPGDDAPHKTGSCAGCTNSRHILNFVSNTYLRSSSLTEISSLGSVRSFAFDLDFSLSHSQIDEHSNNVEIYTEKRKHT